MNKTPEQLKKISNDVRTCAKSDHATLTHDYADKLERGEI